MLSKCTVPLFLLVATSCTLSQAMSNENDLSRFAGHIVLYATTSDYLANKTPAHHFTPTLPELNVYYAIMAPSLGYMTKISLSKEPNRTCSLKTTPEKNDADVSLREATLEEVTNIVSVLHDEQPQHALLPYVETILTSLQEEELKKCREQEELAYKVQLCDYKALPRTGTRSLSHYAWANQEQFRLEEKLDQKKLRTSRLKEEKIYKSELDEARRIILQEVFNLRTLFAE